MSDQSVSPDPLPLLEARIAALERDNAYLRQQLLGSTLLCELAERIGPPTDFDAIIAAAVERLAQACAVCAFGYVDDTAIELVSCRGRGSSSNLAGTTISIRDLPARLRSASRHALVVDGQELTSLGWPPAGVLPTAPQTLLIVPVTVEERTATFVFGFESEGRSNDSVQAFRRAANMVAVRLEGAALTSELKALSHELERSNGGLRAANAHLAEAEAHYRNLVESAVPFYVVAPEGRIIDANEHMCAEIGYTRTALTAMNVWDIDAAFDVEEIEHAIEALARGDKPVRDAFHRRRDGTSCPVETSMSLMQADPEPNILCIVRDVSERTRLEQELWQARKMESIGRLAGGIAHDFNNLLSTIIGHSDLALVDLSPSHPISESIRSIKDAGLRAAELTQQLLAFSRKQTLETKPISLGEVVSNLSRILRRTLGDDIDLHMDISTRSSTIMGDQSQLEQVILNLVVNARDAMPSGGRLTIRTRNVDLGEPAIAAYGVDEPGRYVMLAVQDEGIGIAEEIQDEIFEPFFTTKDASQGTGLGLSTTYGIVRQFRGGIRVRSELGRGTTFEVVFPASPDEAPHDRNDTEDQSLPTGRERLLVVDDHPGVRGMLSRTLARLGYSVLQASDGEEAIRILEASSDAIDLVLSDVVMPGIQGTRLAAEIEKRFPDIAVMLMTGYAPDSLPALQVLQRRPRVLAKPVSPSDLAQAIRDVLTERARAALNR